MLEPLNWTTEVEIAPQVSEENKSEWEILPQPETY